MQIGMLDSLASLWLDFQMCEYTKLQCAMVKLLWLTLEVMSVTRLEYVHNMYTMLRCDLHYLL